MLSHRIQMHEQIVSLLKQQVDESTSQIDESKRQVDELKRILCRLSEDLKEDQSYCQSLKEKVESMEQLGLALSKRQTGN